MATPSEARAVKSLNKSPGRRRFVFKNFSQRLKEVEIDVFRSLDTLKPEPSKGSSFFWDCLMQWRELNTAEDFISFYEEMMMQSIRTLPQVLLHKELIVCKLLSRLQIKARLSLEPILRLIAALSRDLLEDFLPFLQKTVDSLVALLKTGAEREPEILEQVFTAWSYIMMYLQKYLVRDIVLVLKVTIKLRFYPKDYVREFVAESVSFLLRNAPMEQLIRGVRKIMSEVVKKPLHVRKSGVSALLWFVMRGTSLRLHSRAMQVLRLLMDESILGIGDKFTQGRDTVVEVIVVTFQRLCEELEPEELNSIWDCLHEEIAECVTNRYLLHLNRLLRLLISVVQFDNGRKISDYRPMLELLELLVETFISPSSIPLVEDRSSEEVVDKIMQLMLCILDGIMHTSNDMSTISDLPLQWAPVFKLRNSSLLSFIKELLLKDDCLIYAFRANILSVLGDLLESSKETVVYLMLTFSEKMQDKMRSPSLLDELSKEDVLRIYTCLQDCICDSVGLINNIMCGDSSCIQVNEAQLAVLWGIVSCYPHILDTQASPSLLMELVDATDRLLMREHDTIAGIPKHKWQSLIGATLSSYHKLNLGRNYGLEEIGKFLQLAKRYKSSSHVLLAVAEFLDSVNGHTFQADPLHAVFHPELEAKKTMEAINIFAENLYQSDKGSRISTLRILSHYEPLNCELSVKSEDSQSCHTDTQRSDVIQLLLSIEQTPLSISTTRRITLLISRLQMGLSSSRVSADYVPLVFNGIIGIFHNRFSNLWNSAVECLSVMTEKYVELVWDRFVQYFEKYQTIFLNSHTQLHMVIVESPNKSSDLVELFNLFVKPDFDCTPCASILSLLLQSLQKIPRVVESRSRQIIPLFFTFLGYDNDLMSMGSYKIHVSKGKEWKGVLKEWLNLLKLMHNPKSFYKSQFLKEILQNRLLDYNDPELQMKVLDCLLNWKDDFLVPYDHHLKNLVNPKTLREEVVTWSLSSESSFVEGQHRTYLVPLVIRLLMPKVRKLKSLASRKHTSVHHRKAVLGFLAQLDVAELPLFFTMLVKPVLKILEGTTDEFQLHSALKYFTMENINALSWKKKYAFGHVIGEIVGVFDDSRVKPFLNLLMGCVVRLLESCTSNLGIANSNATSSENDRAAANPTMTGMAVKQCKDLRSLCLKIISIILNKYDDHDFESETWDLFFTSVESLINGFKQEGSSSEKPSALFSCFIAMSKSANLVPLLCRKKNLIPDIFSILTVRTASEAIVSCVLKFAENLLSLDKELNNEDSNIKIALIPNIATLISSLHWFFCCDTTMSKRKFVRCPGETELRIFRLLSNYIKDPLAAENIVDILLPFLAKSCQKSDACMEALQVIRVIVPLLRSGNTGNILKAISPFLVSAELDMRLSICDVLDALSKNDLDVLLVAKLVRELNATSVMEIGCLDYDTVVRAYESINIEFFYKIKEDHALILFSHCLYDMSSEELVLRHSAYRLLLSFIEFSAKILSQEVMVETVQDSYWTVDCVRRIINTFLLNQMGQALRKKASVQKEWVDLLREMVLKLPHMPGLNSFKVLCSEDAEVDFFNNITHLQLHRRARALQRFRNVVGAGNLSKVITEKVFVPMYINMLFDLQDGKAEHVRNACIETLGFISGQMQWKSYYALLNRCFREMTTKPSREMTGKPFKQKILIRLICCILGQFHFSQSSSNQTIETQSCLQKTMLPKIMNLLSSNSDNINVNINLAALKILKLLPSDIMEAQLPSIIHRVSNFLKNRLESIRDEARVCLAACLKELGIEYLQFFIRVLKATLKRGYEMHVLGYTLHFILSQSLQNDSKLDYCLDEVLSIVENDIFGDVDEEKEVEKIASKMKETKKRKSFETLKLISQSITFKTHALKLLSPIQSHLQKNLTPKVKSKLEIMLNHVASGIECNPSVNQTDLFVFIYGLVEDGITGENPQKESERSAILKTSKQGSHLITVFALGILHKRLRNMKSDSKNEELLSMLDPFIRLLTKCLNSTYEDVLSASLRCLSTLIKLPLPSLEPNAEKIKARLLDIAQTSPSTINPLMESCLRLLTLLLQSTKITLSSDQLRLLIQFPLFVDLERNPSIVALQLLKAIVKRKLVVHEIYDVVIQVAELMVTSQVEPIRKKCSQILLQFLLDYHLSEKRLQQHLDFLLANLRYEHSTGREAVLEMLHAIIVKFNRNVVDEQAQTIFVHLVVCLANDHDNKVRSMIGASIKLLIGRLSAHSLDSILEYSLSWYMGSKQHLRGASAQVLGLLVEVMKKGFQKHINSVLPVVRIILKSSVNVVRDRELDTSTEATIPFWKEAYYSLVLLEKILIQFREPCLGIEIEDMWEAICELMLHPHMWLRSISNRLVALYFSAATETCRRNHEKSLGNYLLMKPSRLFMIAVSLCCQLKVQLMDSATTNLIQQNLTFSICGLHSLMVQKECLDLLKFWSTLESNEQNYFLKAFQLLDSRKGGAIFSSLSSDLSNQNDQEDGESLRYLLVSSLLKKMGKIALKMEDVQMKVVINSFRTITSQIGSEDCQHFAFDMLLPLYKVCEGFAGKVISDDVKQLAEEVRESIRDALGIQNFVQVYSQIRNKLKAKRDERKQEEKLMAVINPIRNAKRKLRVAEKHRYHKKRKIMAMKMGRWMH